MNGTDEILDDNVMQIEYLIQVTKNVDGIDNLVEMFLMHFCIQLDPGESKDFKHYLD